MLSEEVKKTLKNNIILKEKRKRKYKVSNVATRREILIRLLSEHDTLNRFAPLATIELSWPVKRWHFSIASNERFYMHLHPVFSTL